MTLLCGLRLCCTSHLQVRLAHLSPHTSLPLIYHPLSPCIITLAIYKQKEEGDQILGCIDSSDVDDEHVRVLKVDDSLGNEE
jgi:hypothetical protein